MKIKYIINARIPTEKAHGWAACRLCAEFSNLGVDTELIVPRRINHIQEDAYSFYNLKRGFAIQYVDSFDFFKFQKYLGGKISFYLQSLAYFLKLFFLEIDKDAIVYTRNPEIVWIFSLRGRKTVYECHDWFGKHKNIALCLLKKASKIITTNSYIKKEFLNNKFQQEILVARNGVDLDIFDLNISKQEAVEKLNIDKEIKQKLLKCKVLLYTGSFKTMGEDKGMEDIISSFKYLADDIIFLAIGGNEKDIVYYEKKVMEDEVVGRVFLFDKKEQSELAIFQKSADILLMPFPDKAHYKYHMTPLKMFEYMASDRPIIASNLPSIKEVLEENNCFFCEPDDPKNLAEKINYVLVSGEEAQRKTDKAHYDVKKFTWRKRAENILNHIK
ncbi:MAG: glycosyltransferase [bacterium]